MLSGSSNLFALLRETLFIPWIQETVLYRAMLEQNKHADLVYNLTYFASSFKVTKKAWICKIILFMNMRFLIKKRKPPQVQKPWLWVHKKTYLKKMSEFWVTIRHMWISGSQCRKHVSQSTQRLVYTACFFLPLPFYLRSVQPLTIQTREIYIIWKKMQRLNSTKWWLALQFDAIPKLTKSTSSTCQKFMGRTHIKPVQKVLRF